jgi:hypothetical protein
MVVGSRRSSFEDLAGYIIIIGNTGSIPADAKSLARMHLTDLSARITKVLDTKAGSLDDTTRAHLIESRQRVSKALDSTYTANDL